MDWYIAAVEVVTVTYPKVSHVDRDVWYVYVCQDVVTVMHGRSTSGSIYEKGYKLRAKQE